MRHHLKNSTAEINTESYSETVSRIILTLTIGDKNEMVTKNEKNYSFIKKSIISVLQNNFVKELLLPQRGVWQSRPDHPASQPCEHEPSLLLQG